MRITRSHLRKIIAEETQNKSGNQLLKLAKLLAYGFLENLNKPPRLEDVKQAIDIGTSINAIESQEIVEMKSGPTYIELKLSQEFAEAAQGQITNLLRNTPGGFDKNTLVLGFFLL